MLSERSYRLICRFMPNAQRVELWTQAHGPVPEGMRIGNSCHVQYCGKLEHMVLVEDLTYATRKRSEKYVHIWPHLADLEPGKSIFVAIPPATDVEDYAIGLRRRLHIDNVFRWAVRVYGDKLKITKRGIWGSVFSGVDGEIFKAPKTKKVRINLCLGCGQEFTPKRSKYICCSPTCGHKWAAINKTLDHLFDSPLYKMCSCGCGKIVWPNSKGELRDYKKGHKAKQWMECRQCGKVVPLQQRENCCSRECHDKYRSVTQGIRNLDQRPWEQRPHRWHRIRCVVCHKFVWRKNSSKAKTCYSLSCKQKLMAKNNGVHKVPHDRELLTDLVINKKMVCADINRMFGAHPFSTSAKTALEAVGLRRVLNSKWQNRIMI